MFPNFKLPQFFSGLSLGSDSDQQKSIDQTETSFISQKHSIQKFYEDYMLVDSYNQVKEALVDSRSLLSDSSLPSFNQDNVKKGENNAEVLCLRYKKPGCRFIEVSREFYDHFGIKLAISDNKQKQMLIQKLERQFQYRKRAVIKPQLKNSQKSDSSLISIQLPVNYYIEEVNSICFKHTYLYLVFVRWEAGVIQRLNPILNRYHQMNYRERDKIKLDKVGNVVLNLEKEKKELENEFNNKNSSVSTLMSLRNRNFNSFSGKTFSPIIELYKAQSLNQKIGFNKNSVRVQYGKQSIPLSYNQGQIGQNQRQKNQFYGQLARQLLVLIKSTVTGLRQLHQLNDLGQELRVCDLIIEKFDERRKIEGRQGQYKVVNRQIPESVRRRFVKTDNKELKEGQSLNRRLQQFSIQLQDLSHQSYPSPQQLSHTVSFSQYPFGKQNVMSEIEQDERLGSLLFKLGMICLDLWGFYLSMVDKSQLHNCSKNKFRAKVYCKDVSFLQQRHLKGKEHSIQLSKINWLQLRNILRGIQEFIQVNFSSEGNHKNPSLYDMSHKHVLQLFHSVLRCLLNRSSMQRRKILSLVDSQQFISVITYQLKSQPIEQPRLSRFLSSKVKPVHISKPMSHFQSSSIAAHRNIEYTQSDVNLRSRGQDLSMGPVNNLLGGWNTVQKSTQVQSGYIDTNTKKNQSKSSIYHPNQTLFPFQQQLSSQHNSSPNITDLTNPYPQKITLNSYSDISQKNSINLTIRPNKLKYIPNQSSLPQTIEKEKPKTILKPKRQGISDLKIEVDRSKQTQKTKQFVFQLLNGRQFQDTLKMTPDFKQLISYKARKQEVIHQAQSSNQVDSMLDTKNFITIQGLDSESPLKRPLFNKEQSLEFGNEIPNHLPESSQENIIVDGSHKAVYSCSQEKILILDDSISMNSLKDQREIENKIIEQPQVGNYTQSQHLTIEPQHDTKLIDSPHQNNKSSPKSNNNSPRSLNDQFLLKSPPSQPDKPQTRQLQYVIEQYKGGGRYYGYMRDKKRNGYGKLYYHQGSQYEGEWLQDQMNGYGKLYYKSGKIAYQGNWLQDEFHGTGKVCNDNPTMLDDTFDYTNFNNLQEQWIYYQGELQHDLKQGHGIIMLQNGESFQGEFFADKINGHGKFTNLEGEVVQGIWRNNVVVQMFEG